MYNSKRCKCGSADVVYVIQKGRRKKLEAFCEYCLPVENEPVIQTDEGAVKRDQEKRIHPSLSHR